MTWQGTGQHRLSNTERHGGSSAEAPPTHTWRAPSISGVVRLNKRPSIDLVEIWVSAAVAIAAVVIAVLFLVGRRLRVVGVDPTQLTLDPLVMQEVRALIISGDKGRAVSLLREHAPGLAPVTAAAIVDRMALAATRQKTAGPPGDTAPSAALVPLEIELEARNLKSQGQLVPAITLIREQIGFDLKDAQDYVNGL